MKPSVPILLLLFLGLESSSGQNSEALQVITDDGRVQGTYLQAAEGNLLAGFLGVPYAQPPVGDLRFRRPKDPLPWTGVRDTTQIPASCVQRRDHFFGDFSGSKAHEPMAEMSEDCLFLNIYVPNVMATLTNESAYKGVYENGLPVMVWFHGGGFAQGSSFPQGSQSWTPDPRELAVRGEVMIVTVQYRLGSLGFLYLDDEGAPGNVGLLDQKKALSWLKNNIFAFGGDPAKMTLAGQDAGGVSAAIHALVADELDQRLYQKLVLHSAGLQHPWSFVKPEEAMRRALKLASLVGCPTYDRSRQYVLLCLTRKPADEILNKEMGVAHSGLDFYPFVPTIDGDFLREEPKTLLRRLDERKFPLHVLIGTNADEGSKSLMYFLPQLFPNRELREPGLDLTTFSGAIRKIFGDDGKQVQDAIKFQYTNWSHPNNEGDHFEKITELVGDAYYKCSIDQLADKLSERFDVFKYRFSVRNPTDEWPKWSGVKHGDELDYLFGRPLVQKEKFPETDVVLASFIMKSWMNFVKLGNPSGGRGRGKTIGWPKFKQNTRQVLQFEETRSLVVSTENEAENCVFWNHLVPSLQAEDKKNNQHNCQGHNQVQVKKRKKVTSSGASIALPIWTFTKRLYVTKFPVEQKQSLVTPNARSDVSTSTVLPTLIRKVANQRPLGNRPYFLVKKSTTSTVAPTTTTTTTATERMKPPKPVTLSTSFETKPYEYEPFFTAASTMSMSNKRRKPALYFDKELPPINSLRRKNVFSASRPDYKLVSSSHVITEETAKSKMPDKTKLSYSLSVADKSQPSSDRPGVWTLYKPDKPGNSPIYVARGTFQKEEETSESEEKEEERPFYNSRPRPRTTTTTTRRPSRRTTRRTTTTRRPFVRNRTNVRPKPPSTYDPFNVSEYTQPYFNRRKRKDEETMTASASSQVTTTDRDSMYYPNYVPST